MSIDSFLPIDIKGEFALGRIVQTCRDSVSEMLRPATAGYDRAPAITLTTPDGTWPSFHIALVVPSPGEMLEIARSLNARELARACRPRRHVWSSGNAFANFLATAVLCCAKALGCDPVRVDCYLREHSISGMASEREVIRVTLSSAQINQIDFRHVDAVRCLDAWGAEVATPWFDGELMIKNTERPPNSLAALLQLTPGEFENQVGAILATLGLRVEVTQGSWDGGIDCVAIDPRPIIGGKIIVQAKRYDGVVPASAVRDLYGTVMSEGASKGVLITTGTFGPTSRDFASGKPIELIDGGELASMLPRTAAFTEPSQSSS